MRSFGFDLALQAVLDRCLQRAEAEGVVLRSLTDDCNLAVQLPSDEAQAHAVLTRLHAALTALAADAKATLNLDLNLDKCALLLPPGHATAAAPSCSSYNRHDLVPVFGLSSQNNLIFHCIPDL